MVRSRAIAQRSSRGVAAVLVFTVARGALAQAVPPDLPLSGGETDLPVTTEVQRPLVPDLRPRIAKLDDLAPFAFQDAVVAERVQRIEHQQTTALYWFGAALGSGVLGIGLAVPREQNLCFGSDCGAKPLSSTGAVVLAVAALGLAAIGSVLLATNGTAQETVELWNQRHPEAPLRWAQDP